MAGNRNSGRRRLPTAVKLRRGSKIRHDIKREPKYTVGVPDMPTHIEADPIAKTAWLSFADRLVEARVLTKAHAEPLTLLCEAWARYRRAVEEWRHYGFKHVAEVEIRKPGGIITTRLAENPLAHIVPALEERVKKLLGEFGLTPATASKVQTHAEREADPFEEFLRGPNVVEFRK
jgi:P27 family predicted phage terminase small subunit